MDTDYDQFKLSKYVDDFIVDNINNMTSDFTSSIRDPSDSETFQIDKLTIEQYFPWKSNLNYNNLKIDETGKFSITLPKKADNISRIILTYCNNLNLNNEILLQIQELVQNFLYNLIYDIHHFLYQFLKKLSA